jgi:hypothetical protein
LAGTLAIRQTGKGPLSLVHQGGRYICDALVKAPEREPQKSVPNRRGFSRHDDRNVEVDGNVASTPGEDENRPATDVTTARSLAAS